MSAVHELNVPDLIGDLITMSDLLISSSRAGDVTHPEPEDDSLLPLLGRPPTGRRQFSHAEQLEVNAEIYEGAEVRHVGDRPFKFHAVLQVCHILDIFAELRNDKLVAGIAARF